MTAPTFVKNTLFPYRYFEGGPDLSDVEIVPLSESPWLAEIEYPIPVDAPPSADPHCCYIRTVIFYETPPRIVDGDLAEHGRWEAPLQLDDILSDGGTHWHITGGHVALTKGRWNMVWKLRKVDE